MLQRSAPLLASLVFSFVLIGCGGGSGGGAAPQVDISASPSQFAAGNNVTVTWSSTNANACTASGAWDGDLPLSGSHTYTINNPGRYVLVLTCTGPGGSDTAAAQFDVTGNASGAPTVVLTANPMQVAVGGTTTLTWSTDTGQTCEASGGWTGTKSPSGSEPVTVTTDGQNFFGLSCTGPTGTGSQGVYVTGLQATVAISADPTTVGPGQTTTLTWSSTQADSCTASGAWSGSRDASGTATVTVPATGDNTFTLTCANPGAAATQSAVVSGSLPDVTLSIFPANVVTGKTATLRWKGNYATSCTASGAWTGSRATSGFVTFAMTAVGTNQYHLSCTNAGGSSAKDATVTVSAKPAFPPATAYRMTESHDGVLLTANGVSHPPSTTPLWTRDLGAPVSYPLIAEGKVFVTTANPDQSYGNRLYALNPTNGATLWGPIAVPGTYFGSGLSYDNGRVFVLMFDGVIRAFNAANGAALWTTQLPGYWYDGSPNAYGGLVFIDGNGGLSAVDESDGHILYTVTAPTTDWVSPAVSSEGVYAMDGYNCNASAFTPVAGDELWRTHTDCDSPWGFTPAVKNGLFFGRAGSSIDLLDAGTGAVVSQLASARGPAITDTAFVALNSGTLSSTRLSDRVQTWTFTGDGNLVTAPVVVNNTIYVGSSSGNVYGVDTATGLQTWVGVAPQGINQDSETGGPMPPSGPAAGENLLIFPSGTSLVTWSFQ